MIPYCIIPPPQHGNTRQRAQRVGVSAQSMSRYTGRDARSLPFSCCWTPSLACLGGEGLHQTKAWSRSGLQGRVPSELAGRRWPLSTFSHARRELGNPSTACGSSSGWRLLIHRPQDTTVRNNAWQQGVKDVRVWDGRRQLFIQPKLPCSSIAEGPSFSATTKESYQGVRMCCTREALVRVYSS